MRRLLTRVLLPLGLGGALLTILYYYARRIEPHWLDVQELELRIPGLPAGLDGLRVAQLSDLHITRDGPPEVLGRALDAVERARADLVVLTGDLVDDGPEVEIAAAALERLAPRPTYVVFGNHDYDSGPWHVGRMVDLLAERGIRALRDEAVPFERNGSTLWIVGFDDRDSGHSAPGRALASLSPSARPRLLLTHRAEEVEKLPPCAADLALAGHTHGGQIFVPFMTEVLLRRKFGGYAYGRYRVNGIPVYVNRGLGSLGIEARFMRRPEVTVITFRPGKGKSELTPASFRFLASTSIVP